MSSIDPYGLLGATVASTLSEVKQAYFALSLLVHPDKGGSSADMIMVHNAYKYVTGQLSEVNRTTTVEDLEERFAAFCKEQEDETPAFSEISQNDVNRQLFHEAFTATREGDVNGASYQAGYGASMEPSEYSSYVPLEVRQSRCGQASSAPAPAPAAVSVPRQAAVPFQTQITTYVEPETSATDTRLCFSETQYTDGLEDYGSSRPFQMTDYRVAFTTTPEPLPDLSELIMHRTFEDLVQQHRSIPA